MRDVANLVPNAEVKVRDVTVGTVTGVAVEGWHATLTVGLDPKVRLPRNAIAKIGQKSILGAEYLELAPPVAEASEGQLAPNGTIPLDHTDRYPETEEVLAALSVVLNGGGLGQLQTITTELNKAFEGREDGIRALIADLGRFTKTLNDQRSGIVSALDGLDSLSARLDSKKDALAASLDELPQGLAVLNEQRTDLVNALDAVSQLGVVSKRVIDGSRDDLLSNLHDLGPSLARLADAGHNIAGSLLLLPTYPWSSTAFPAIMKGDYVNIFMTIDLSPDMLARNFQTGFAVPKISLLNGLPPLGRGQGGGNPLEIPFLPSVNTGTSHAPRSGSEPVAPLGGPAGDIFSSPSGGPRRWAGIAPGGAPNLLPGPTGGAK
jgi:phospholipid/cholesterol/gamma-HCH transport system substrate-binding protein